MQQNKYKLSMWLLYKAKHCKVNGYNLIADRENNAALAAYITLILSKIKDTNAVLSLVNRYVNLNFKQQLPENLPHIPTWILAAEAYTLLSVNHPGDLINIDESQVLQDIIASGELILEYVQHLAQNTNLWPQINSTLQYEFAKIYERWSVIQLQNNNDCLHGIEKIYQLLLEMPHQWLAYSSPSEQLESFTHISADISGIFDKYILQHIPAEFLAAQQYGLGQLQLNFCVDQAVNTFADLHVPYSDAELPDYARDVLFKVQVYFKYNNSEHRYLLATSWFAHDLGTVVQRFDNYYNRKFKYKLKHNRYHWISLDGMSNQVEGHGNTATHKLIDYDRLATVYQEWLINAVPINDPILQERLKKNTKFIRYYSNLLDSGSCIEMQTQEIEILRALLHNELNSIIMQQRVAVAVAMQQDAGLIAAMAKIDAQYAVLSVFARLLNVNFLTTKLNEEFNVFIHDMQQTHYLDIDLKQHFDSVFVCRNFAISPNESYAHGELYGKIQAVLAQLKILQTELTISRLLVF